MNYLEKLLEGFEVEWKPISKTLVRTKGTNITASQMKVLDKTDAPLKIFAGGKTVAFVEFIVIPAAKSVASKSVSPDQEVSPSFS